MYQHYKKMSSSSSRKKFCHEGTSPKKIATPQQKLPEMRITSYCYLPQVKPFCKKNIQKKIFYESIIIRNIRTACFFCYKDAMKWRVTKDSLFLFCRCVYFFILFSSWRKEKGKIKQSTTHSPSDHLTGLLPSCHHHAVPLMNFRLFFYKLRAATTTEKITWRLHQ